MSVTHQLLFLDVLRNRRMGYINLYSNIKDSAYFDVIASVSIQLFEVYFGIVLANIHI